jgi:hypothetical protein
VTASGIGLEVSVAVVVESTTEVTALVLPVLSLLLLIIVGEVTSLGFDVLSVKTSVMASGIGLEVSTVIMSLMISDVVVTIVFFSLFWGIVVTLTISLVTSGVVVTVFFFWFFFWTWW